MNFKFTLVICSAILFSFGCSMSLNVSGPGDSATPTVVTENLQLAVERTLTALARAAQDNVDNSQPTPDATVMAQRVPTLVAEALLTLQPTAILETATRAPQRPANTPVPPSPVVLIATATPLPTDTPLSTDTPLPTDTPIPTATFTPTPTNTFTPTVIPTHCPQQFCVIMQRCEPGENTRAVGTIYENDKPKNGVRVRVSYVMGGPPVIPDFISGNDPNNSSQPDPLRPGYYQLGLLEGAALAGNWWVFIVDEKNQVLSEGRYFNTQEQMTATSCQVGITDFYR